MIDSLVKQGWIKVVLIHITDKERLDEINEWCFVTFDYGWVNLGNVYVFRRKEDAEWFILKWL